MSKNIIFYAVPSVEDISCDIYPKMQAICNKMGYQFLTPPPEYLAEESKIKRNVGGFLSTIPLPTIPKGSSVLAFGRGTLHLTHSTDFNYLQFLTPGYRSFYHPSLDSTIYPLPGLTSAWKGKNYYGRYEEFIGNRLVSEVLKEIDESEPYVKKFPEYKVVTDMNFEVFIQVFANEKVISFDLETQGFSALTDEIICFSLAVNDAVGYVFEWNDHNKELLFQFLEGKRLVGHNIVFDLRFLYRNGLRKGSVSIEADTLSMVNIFNETLPHSLSNLSWVLGECGGYDILLEQYKKENKIKNYADIPKKLLYKYAAIDALVTLRLYHRLSEALPEENPNLSKYHKEIIAPTVEAFSLIEDEGIPIDVDALRSFREILEEDRQRLFIEVKKDFQLDDEYKIEYLSSPKKLVELFTATGIDTGVLTAKGAMSTAAGALDTLVLNGETRVKNLAEYRKATHLQNSLTERGKTKGLGKDTEVDGCIYPSFGKFLATTHRFTCKNPNLQSQSKSKEFRKIFSLRDTKNYYLAELDGANLQARLIASQANDPLMTKEFLKKGDLHALTAYNIFSLEKKGMTYEDFLQNKGEEPYKSMRYIAKTANFSLFFNTSARQYAVESLHPIWTSEEAQEFCRNNNLPIGTDPYLTAAEFIKSSFFRTYPSVLKYNTANIAKAKRDYKLSIPVFGATRHMDIMKYERAKTHENVATNTGIQSIEIIVVASSILYIMRAIKEKNLQSRVLAMVHDSVVLALEKSEVEVIFEAFIRGLNAYFDTLLNRMFLDGSATLADLEKGDSWGFGQEYTKDYQGEYVK